MQVLLSTSCKSDEARVALWTALFCARGSTSRAFINLALQHEPDRDTRRGLLQARRAMADNPLFPV